ncbi:MAG: uracil-DNA glycosylase [Methylococcales bacterium]|jgi:uracil-DNA glycosylase|nr:uracil-DNA glycosylase [Methylococcales bacterium]
MTYLLDEHRIEQSWKELLKPEFSKPYWQTLKAYLKQRSSEHEVYPTEEDLFSAFSLTPFDQVRAVIVGQDPYHSGQAHGLSFSVLEGHKIPPSLKNIYKAIHQQIGPVEHKSGDLTAWAEQGILMLNAVLTVEKGNAAAHQKQGWENFTDKVIELLNEKAEPIVFLLWGAYAKEKGKIIDKTKHCVLESVHPSPFSARLGFFDNEHFTKLNAFLEKNGSKPVTF